MKPFRPQQSALSNQQSSLIPRPVALAALAFFCIATLGHGQNRLKDKTEATTPAADDWLYLDGTINGVRKLAPTYYQPKDTDLTAIAALTTTSFGRSLLTLSAGTTGQFLQYDGTWASPSASVAWGSITGTLASQSDLTSALAGKQASGNYITALTGDVTASGPGSVAATVTKINGTSLAGLATGILKNTTSTGVPSIAVSGTDYAPATSGSAILKGNGAGGFSSATSGTDYAPATSGSALLKGNGAGGFSSAASGTDYAPATSGSAILKGNGAGGFSAASSGTDYEVPLTFSTGLTRSTNTITVNTSQNIATLSNLTSNGFVKTSGGTGALSIDTNTYLTTASAASTYQPLDAALTALAGGSDFVAFSGPATATKTFTLPNASATILTSNAAVTEAQGGTNQTTYTTGDTLYSSASNTLSKLAGNTTTTKNFLTQTGNGSVSAAPAWGTIVNGDVPTALTGKTYNGLTLTANATGFSVAGGTTSKTLTVSNTLTLAGTDSSTLNIGSGGTLGTAAYTASSAYQAVDAALTALAAGSDFVQFTGPTSSTKVFTLPNANATLARTDAGQTFTGANTFSSAVTLSAGATTASTINAGSLISATGSGYASYQNFFSQQNAANSDSLAIGQSGSTYAGAIGSVGNSQAFLYSPARFTIARGTGSTAAYHFDTGGLTVAPTTSSTSTTTGALIVSGGVGVAGAGFVGGNLTGGASASGVTIGFNSAGPTNDNGTYIYRTNGSGSGLYANAGHLLFYPRTSAATYRNIGFLVNDDSTGNSVTETLRVEGANTGAGVGGYVKVLGTSSSSSTSTGALIVSGGVGVAGGVYASNFNGNTVTVGTGTLTLTASKTLTVNQTTTLDRQSSTGLPVEFLVAASDETTAITTGTAKVTFRAPYAFTITEVRASLTTVSSSGTPTVDINEAGTTILSTKLTIDANEKTSTTAATPPVISDTAIADDAEITIDIDVAGTGAAGLKVLIKGYR